MKAPLKKTILCFGKKKNHAWKRRRKKKKEKKRDRPISTHETKGIREEKKKGHGERKKKAIRQG